MKKIISVLLIFVGCVASVSASYFETIDFEGVGVGAYTSYTEGMFEVTNSGGGEIRDHMLLFDLETQYSTLDPEITLTRTDGGTFAQVGFDIYTKVIDLGRWGFWDVFDSVAISYELAGGGSGAEVFTAADVDAKYDMASFWFIGVDGYRFNTFGENSPFQNLTSLSFFSDDGHCGYKVGIDNIDLAYCSPVPEPSSYALMLVGLFGLAAYRRKKMVK